MIQKLKCSIKKGSPDERTGFRSSRSQTSNQLFLKNSQILQKNICVGVSFNRVVDLQHRFFPVKFAKFLRTPFFTEQVWWLPGTKAGATVSNKYQIQLKKSICCHEYPEAATIQCKRRPATLLKRGTSIAKFLNLF